MNPPVENGEGDPVGTPSVTIASTLTEALAAVADGATPVAGGTDLVVGHRQGKAPLPQRLVAIDRLDELSGIGPTDDGGVRIGALVSHAQLMTDQAIVGHYTALADGAALIGSPATRAVGTLGGNVMNASPAMDTGAPLVVLGGTVELTSSDGARVVSPIELWTGPGSTSAASSELMAACLLPPRPPRSGSAYVRLEYRRAMEIAVVGAAAAISLDEAGDATSLALALTAVGPTIIAVDGLEDLIGRPVDQALLEDVTERASEQATPISDLRAGDAYRRHCVGVMARRALAAAQARAGGDNIAVPVNRSIGIGADGATATSTRIQALGGD